MTSDVRRLACILCLTAFLGAFCTCARASGFNIYEMGTRATALGGAFTAAADDPTALFYNPAGLAWLPDGFSLSGNLSVVSPRTKFTRASGATPGLFPGNPTAETRSSAYFPVGLYVSYRHDERWSGGVGFFTPFGLGVDWEAPESFAGRTIGTNTQIRGFYASPMVTFRPIPQVAVSGGPHFVLSTVNLESIRTQPFGTDNTHYNVIDVTLEGTSDLSVGVSGAVMVRPSRALSFGINYKSGVRSRFSEEDVRFDQILTGISLIDAAVGGQLDQMGRRQKVSADLDYPDILAVGARVQPWRRVRVLADFVWFQWSDFNKVEFEFTNPLLNETLRQDYHDGQQWRFGLDYEWSPRLRTMAGFVYDKTPQPRGGVGPLLPDADRLDYSLGMTYTHDSWELSIAYMFVDFEERSTVVDGNGVNWDGFDGSYASAAHIPSVGVSYHFQ